MSHIVQIQTEVRDAAAVRAGCRRLQLDVEKAKLEAHKAGHCVTEQSLADGSIKLTVQVGRALCLTTAWRGLPQLSPPSWPDPKVEVYSHPLRCRVA